jgi:Asp/Glu/hydantoin racemase
VHVVFVQLLKKRTNNVLERGLRWELDALLVGCVDDTEVFMVRDVEEVDVLL